MAAIAIPTPHPIDSKDPYGLEAVVVAGAVYGAPSGMPPCCPTTDWFEAGACVPYCGACDCGGGIVGAVVVIFAGAVYGAPSGMPPCCPTPDWFGVVEFVPI